MGRRGAHHGERRAGGGRRALIPVVVNAIRLAADGVLAVLLAPACASCGEALEHPTGGPVCAACWSAIVPITPPTCMTCGDALPTWRSIGVATARCARCRRMRSAIARTVAVGPYEGSLRAIVHAFKYQSRETIARPLAACMRECGAAVLDGVDAIVPVPLHRSRERQRGFNQARELARHLGPPVVDALRRTRRTAAQADLPAARRHANVRGAFVIDARVNVAGSTILLVDDVSTTGATLNACATALTAAGAREIRALIAARAVTRAP